MQICRFTTLQHLGSNAGLFKWRSFWLTLCCRHCFQDFREWICFTIEFWRVPILPGDSHEHQSPLSSAACEDGGLALWQWQYVDEVEVISNSGVGTSHHLIYPYLSKYLFLYLPEVLIRSFSCFDSWAGLMYEHPPHKFDAKNCCFDGFLMTFWHSLYIHMRYIKLSMDEHGWPRTSIGLPVYFPS